MAEANVVFDGGIDDMEETLDSPVGLGEAAGIDEPFPYRLRMPVKGKPKDEWPVATIWLHPFTLGIAAKCRHHGIDPNPQVTDLVELERQNRFLSQELINKNKGWDNLIRINGTQWIYKPCSKEDNGTEKDPRVLLSQCGAYFGLIKARTIGLAFTLAQEAEGNSESSSDIPMAVTDEPNENERPNDSQEN